MLVEGRISTTAAEGHVSKVHATHIEDFFSGGGGLVLFAGLAVSHLAGVFTQFIQCGEYRSAVKGST